MSENIIGNIYGKLTVKSFSHELCVPSKRQLRRYKYYNCVCSCGGKKIVMKECLCSGKTKSCGCLIGRNKKHGMSGTSIYKSWASMKDRCLNKKCKEYKYYGSRKITICDRWLESFENFYKDMGDRPKGKTLDRRDNNDNYCKKNCRWATAKTQARNKRNTIFLEYRGEKKALISWAEELGVAVDCLKERYRLGWSVEEILTIPSQKGNNQLLRQKQDS